MTNRARFIRGLLPLFLLAGCSYSTDFVFLNGTSAPARVSYTYRSPVGSDDPAISDRAKGPWQVLPRTGYAVTPDRLQVTVVVPPGRALRLFTISNYPGNDLRGLERFPVSEITIADERSAVTVKNERALLAFQRWNDRLYVFPAYEVRIRPNT